MNNQHLHDDAGDNWPPPLWATVSWILAAVAFVVLALGLTGMWAFPYFPGVAVGLLVLAAFVRLLNDWLFRKRQTAS